MNKHLLLFFLLTSGFSTVAQNFTGQWRGEFYDKSNSRLNWSDDKVEYVLELEVKGTAVSGSSYTYFTGEGKRYYTICKVEGFIVKNKNYIEIRETERTKTNVPENVHNCLQVHKLTYSKEGEIESIEGNWKPAPNQSTVYDCGYGTTALTRRNLQSSFPNFNSNAGKSVPVKKQIAKTPVISTPLVAKNQVKKPNKPIPPESTLNKRDIADNVVVDASPATPLIVEKSNVPTPASKLEKRASKLIKTIEVENETVRVDLYDNGEIDGDSVSVFYNGKLLVSNRKLSDKPLSLKLTVDDSNKVNELVMYAENLGSIPPNTALMIVTDGPNRYEVRITSDLQKSGSINFVHRGGLGKAE